MHWLLYLISYVLLYETLSCLAYFVLLKVEEGCKKKYRCGGGSVSLGYALS